MTLAVCAAFNLLVLHPSVDHHFPSGHFSLAVADLGWMKQVQTWQRLVRDEPALDWGQAAQIARRWRITTSDARPTCRAALVRPNAPFNTVRTDMPGVGAVWPATDSRMFDFSSASIESPNN